MSSVRILPVTALFLITGLPLSAQVGPRLATAEAEPATRGAKGLWMGVGVGAGSSLVTCGICREDRLGGPSGYMGLGATLRPDLLVGAEGTIWVHASEEIDQYLGALTLAAYLYPRRGSGFFVKGGLSGLRYVATEDGSAGEDDASATTLGVGLGVGYEFPIRPGYALVPFLNLVASSFGSLSQGGETLASDLNVSLIQFGVGLTGH